MWTRSSQPSMFAAFMVCGMMHLSPIACWHVAFQAAFGDMCGLRFYPPTASFCGNKKGHSHRFQDPVLLGKDRILSPQHSCSDLFTLHIAQTCFLRRKITGNMSSDELSVSRTLLIAFALFILVCGLGHGINARKAVGTELKGEAWGGCQRLLSTGKRNKQFFGVSRPQGQISEIWQAIAESSSDFLDVFQRTVHLATAITSVCTSVLLGVWLPKLLVDTQSMS